MLTTHPKRPSPRVRRALRELTGCALLSCRYYSLSFESTPTTLGFEPPPLRRGCRLGRNAFLGFLQGCTNQTHHTPQGIITVPLLCSEDRKSTRLNSSHHSISYAVFCL